MNLYECIFIARQDVSPSQVDAIISAMAAVVDSMGGKLEKTENCGLRQLAYPVRKNKKGHYAMMYFNGNGEIVKEIRRKMGVHEDVIRSLIVMADAVPAGASILSASRGFRDSKREFGHDKPKGAFDSGRGSNQAREDVVEIEAGE